MRDLNVDAWIPWIVIPVVVFSWLAFTPLDFTIIQSAYAQDTPITPSGLHTQVSNPIAVGGQTQYNITGGTRPGGGVNLFHSFGEFGVPLNNIANFLNGVSFDLNGVQLPPGLSTSNILARVTGTNGNNPTLSSIYGTIQMDSSFGTANLFLMNPAGFLFGPNATVNVGGMMTFTTADYIRLADGGGFNANPNATPADLLIATPVAAFGFLGSNPNAITVQGSQFTVTQGTGISLIGGNISIGADPETGTPAVVSAPSGEINLVSVASPGEVLYPSLERGPNIINQTFTAMGTVTVSDFATLDVSGNSVEGDGHAGSIRIRGGQFILENFSFLTASTVGDVSGDAPGISVIVHEDATAGVTGNVTLHNVSGIITGTGSGTGRDGGIEIVAKHVEVADGSFILTGSSGPAAAGNIMIQADTISLGGAIPDLGVIANISSLGSDAVEGGTISLSGRTSSGQTLSLYDQGQILTSTLSGRSGDITLNMNNVTMSGDASLQATSSSIGAAGNILVTAKDTFSLTGLSTDRANIISNILSISNQFPANISIETGAFLLSEGARIDGQTSALTGGQISISATDSITVQSGSTITSISNLGTGASLTLSGPTVHIDHSTISARSAGTADGGMISAHATNGNLILENGSVIASSTGGSGLGGSVIVTASDSVQVIGGSRIESTAFSTSSGRAGSVTIEATTSPAQSVLIDGADSGIFTDTHGTGAGGNIFVNTHSLTLQNGGTLSSATSGTASSATGGSIQLDANQAQLHSGATITANSTGAAGAGDINITATNSLSMQNSSITTQAAAASGGAIKITTNPGGTVQLTNSTISASVLDGTGGGGSVNIDPQSVILLNSQILAQAVQGPGGNISITTNLLLSDANSVISASSKFGVNGTVTIQSPNAPISGQIQPLGGTPLPATSLLNQRCASLAGGEFSSFTVAGRDSLPTEPGGWLSSPLAALSAGTGLAARGEGEGLSGLSGSSGWLGLSGLVRAGSAAHQIDQTNQINETNPTVLSLRQIAPPGFLTQAFATDRSAGCTS